MIEAKAKQTTLPYAWASFALIGPPVADHHPESTLAPLTQISTTDAILVADKSATD